jgi:hypothetical protein
MEDWLKFLINPLKLTWIAPHPGIHLSVLNKHLNSFKEYKGLLIFSFSQALPHPSAEHVVGPGERIMTHAGVAPKDA